MSGKTDMPNAASDMDDEDSVRVYRRNRRAAPRIGSFVTIAAALLMLFGAASRMGKVDETAALFGIDRQAESSISKQEANRLRALVTLGAVPVVPEETQPQSAGMPMNALVMPPQRGEVDLDAVRRNSAADANRHAMSLAVPADRRNDSQPESLRPGADVSIPLSVEDFAQSSEVRPGTQPVAPAPAAARQNTYVVAAGDTWVKIAKRTLGDAKRWQELLKANPNAKNGLEVGMRLTIP